MHGEMSSRNPVDILIRDLIRTGRTGTSDELDRIIDHMAAAPFSRESIRVPIDERGTWYQGHQLAARAESLSYHLVKRVVIEQQWVDGTSAAQYVEDVRRAVRHPSARLTVYERRGGYLAATVTPTDVVLTPARRGVKPERQLLVIYSADRGIIVTGYQFSELSETGIPSEARWLK